MARILGALEPGILGQGPVRAQEILNGSADAVPLLCAAELDAGEYEEALAVLGQKGDLKRWYRDQSYFIEIREVPRARSEVTPSGFAKWKFLATRTHIPGKKNLYQEWEDIKRASEVGRFVLFSIDPAYRDRHVEESLSSLGQIYYIRQLDDLISLVVEVSERAYGGESFIFS